MAVKQPKPGMSAHTAGIFADMTLDGPEIGTLVAVIDRAKNLPNRKTMGKQNPYCAMRLGKEAKKSNTDRRGGQTPKWDQELRFTVHDSPDYYRLKCSVFNDDKRTDLIGEAWLSLSELIKPGGGSNDLWHQLNYKGKYAGDIRIELTYYDMRPREEKVSEKKKTRDKTSSMSADANSPASGPRQLGPREARRRPLPASPASISPAQTPPVSTQQEQAHLPPPKIQYERHVGVPAAKHSEDYRDFDPYANDFPAVQPPVHYHQPYLGDQPIMTEPEVQDEFMQIEPYYQPSNMRHSDAPSFNRSQSSDLSDSWNDRQSPRVHADQRRTSQYEPENDYYDSQQFLSNQPFYQPEASQYGSPRSAISPVKNIPFRDSPLRHSISQEADLPRMGEAASSSDLPPPPPKHRETTPRRQQLDYAPSSFPQQDTVVPGNTSQSLAMTYKKASVSDYSPLQHLEHEYSSIGTPSDTLNQSWAESNSDREHARRQSQTSRSTLQTPERQSSYNAYNPQAYDYSERDYYHQPSVADVYPEETSQRPIYDRTSSYGDYQQTTRAGQLPDTEDPMSRYHSQPSLPLTSYHKPQPIRPQSMSSKPQLASARKAVGSGPYPDPVGRRLSDNPYSPDTYDVLNPASSPVTNDGTIFQSREQPKEAQHVKEEERLRDDAPIIGNDGRVIDPSDHLPSDTWAPEPERKQRKPEHVIHVRTKNDTRSRTTPNSSPASLRANHHRQLTSQGSPAASPNSAPSPTVRSRAQKPISSRPLPQQPYPQPAPVQASPSVDIAGQQALRRLSYQDVSTQIHRPQLSEYQVPVGSSYTPRRESYNPDHQVTPHQALMRTGQNFGSSYNDNYDDPLAAEMSMIDIGPSRNSRVLVRHNAGY